MGESQESDRVDLENLDNANSDGTDAGVSSSISEELTPAQRKEILNSPEFQSEIQRHTGKEISKLKKNEDQRKSDLDRMGELMASGKNADEAKQIIRQENAVDYVEKLQSGGGDPGDGSASKPGGGASPEVLDFSEAFKAAGYDVSDIPREEYDFSQSFKGTQVELQNALIARAQDDQGPEHTGNSGISGQPRRMRPKPKNDLAGEYDAEVKKRMEGVSRAADRIAILDEIKSDFRKKGYDVV